MNVKPLRRWLQLLCMGISATVLCGCSEPPARQGQSIRPSAQTTNKSAPARSIANVKKVTNDALMPWAKYIPADTVTHIVFYGPNLGCFANRPLAVKDRTLIQKFVTAIDPYRPTPPVPMQGQPSPALAPDGQPYQQIPIGNGVDTMEIHHHIKNKKAPEITTFRINFRSPASNYGPHLVTAVQAFIEYQRQQLHQYIKSHRSQIQEIASITSITDSKQIQEILPLLESDSEYLFSSSEVRPQTNMIVLKLRNGVEKRFPLFIARDYQPSETIRTLLTMS